MWWNVYIKKQLNLMKNQNIMESTRCFKMPIRDCGTEVMRIILR